MTPFQLLEHMKVFKYAVYTKNNKQYVQQPKNLEKTKTGSCYDQSLYIYNYLTNSGYKCKLIFFTNNDLRSTHSFVLFKENNHTYWIENAYEKFKGIHEVKNGYNDVLKLWASDEKLNPDDVAVNDDVDTSKLLINRDLTYEEYIQIVTKPFLSTEKFTTMHLYDEPSLYIDTPDLLSSEEDLSNVNLIPQKLNRTLLESNDPTMKQKVMAEIAVLTNKLKQQKTHFYLAPQIDDELVYKYLRYFPEEVSFLNKWIRFPNKNWNNKLFEVAKKLSKFVTFNKDSTTLYRGFHHSNKESIKNQKYPQQRMGLSEVETEGSVLKKPGGKFQYPLLNPTSFTRSEHIANKFGTILISTSMKHMNHPFIDNNDSLIAAVFINNGMIRIPKLWDHVKFLKEVIVVPTKELLTFHIKQSPVPLYFTPFNIENAKKNTNIDPNVSLSKSLYSDLLTVMGLASFDTNEFTDTDTFYTNEEIGEEGLFSSNENNTIMIKSVIDISNAIKKLVEENKIPDQAIAMVAKTTSTRPVFHANMFQQFDELGSLISNIKNTVYTKINTPVFNKDIVEDTKKLITVANKMGFKTITKSRKQYDLSEELDYKKVHGRLAERGYKNYTVLNTIMNYIEKHNSILNDCDMSLQLIKKVIKENTRFDDSFMKDIETLKQTIINVELIVTAMIDSFFSVLKTFYPKIKDYIKNYEHTQTKKNMSATEKYKSSPMLLSQLNRPAATIVELTYPSETEIKSFNDLYFEAIHIRNLLMKVELTTGTENMILSGIIRFFTGIVNIVIGMVNTFKTNVFKYYKDLKRSELRYFHESNYLSVKRIFNFDYGQLSDLQIPIPNKMGVPYLEATEAAVACLNVMNMEERSKAFANMVSSMKESVLSGKELGLYEFGSTSDIKNIQQYFKKFDDCFRGRQVRTVVFSEVFPTMQDFTKVDNLLLSGEVHEQSVTKVNASLDSCVARMEEILQYLNKDIGQIEKKDLILLSDASATLAKMFDMFGVTIQDFSRIEHNYVEVLKVIRKQFNL